MSQAKGQGLRVLVTLDAVGGVWQYGLDLARGLAARGNETVLAICGPAPDEAQRDEARQVPGATVIETGLPLDWLCDGPSPMLRAGAAVAEIAQDLKVDVAQLNMPTLAAATAMGVPVVAVTHGCVSTWWEAAKPGEALAPEYHWHRDMMGKGLRAADQVVAPTVAYAATVSRHYGLGQMPRTVHNGRRLLLDAVAEIQAPEVLTVGRLWDQVKCADVLDGVARRLDVPIAAAGATVGPHGENPRLTHLELLGQLDSAALAERLARRPIFVSAASFEPFGLAVLEAAQAGCALVLSDIDTFRELWDGAAVFVPPHDETAFTRAIEMLLAQPDLRRRLGERARSHAAGYTPQVTADAMLAIYADALATSPQAKRVAA